MYMVIDMLYTEAVIALAAGAITKLKLRIICIGSAADRAFVGVKLGSLFIADFCRLLTEIQRALACFLGQESLQIGAAENEEINEGDNRQEVYGERIAKDAYKEKDRVYKCKELHAHRQEEHEQHLHIGVHGRKGKEHGQIDVA